MRVITETVQCVLTSPGPAPYLQGGPLVCPLVPGVPLVPVPGPPLGQLDPQGGVAGEDDRRARDDLGQAGQVGGEADQQQQEPGGQPRQHPDHVQPRPHYRCGGGGRSQICQSQTFTQLLFP